MTELLNENVRQILSDNIIGSLATVNEDGSPWVTPIHVFSDDEAVYWFSAETPQHSQNIVRNGQASVALFSPDLTGGPKGVYVNGAATVLDVEDTTNAKKLIEAKIGKIPQNFVEATAYRLAFGAVNSSKSSGNCWYFYS